MTTRIGSLSKHSEHVSSAQRREFAVVEVFLAGAVRIGPSSANTQPQGDQKERQGKKLPRRHHLPKKNRITGVCKSPWHPPKGMMRAGFRMKPN